MAEKIETLDYYVRQALDFFEELMRRLLGVHVFPSVDPSSAAYASCAAGQSHSGDAQLARRSTAAVGARGQATSIRLTTPRTPGTSLTTVWASCLR